jgi:protein arginine kinase
VSQLLQDLPSFAQRACFWLRPLGPDSDVVVSSRVRLARNVEDFPFITRLQADRAIELRDMAREHLVAARLGEETIFVPMEEASPILRLLLRERHLISRDLAPIEDSANTRPGRAVAFGADERVSVMVNEEDHLRIQALAPGLDLDSAWDSASALDRRLEQNIRFAHSRKLGYLTGCPTNVGTGLRASVMLHLPALSLVRSELEKVFTAAQRTGLAVRGLYGEGSRAAGDFYQISNQVTLGRTESQLIDDLRALVPVIVGFERTVRDALFADQRTALADRVARSHGLLRTARSMATDSALAHLSNLRLGMHLGLFDHGDLEVLNVLRVQVQQGHVQALNQDPLSGDPLDASARDQLRAGFLRRQLAR